MSLESYYVSVQLVSPIKETRPAQSDESRVPLSQRAEPVAECDLAEVDTGFY